MRRNDLAPTSLARRFAVSAAALAMTALFLISIMAWWLVNAQHARSESALELREAEFHAVTISRTLHALADRMSEVAQNNLLATGLVDSAGRDMYLTPYLSSIRQVNGIAIQIFFVDFEGELIASNGNYAKPSRQQEWLRQQLALGEAGATIFDSDETSELVAVEMVRLRDTPTPEGAVLYKLHINDIHPALDERLAWHAGSSAAAAPYIVPIAVPDIFASLGLHLITARNLEAQVNPFPHYLIIVMLAITLALAVYLIGSHLAWSLTKDLRRLDDFARGVMREGFGTRRAEERGSAEVAGLARSINHMLDRLHEQHALVEQETQKLHQLANTIPQLAWIADPDGTIHWYNERWYEYVGMQRNDAQAALWMHTTHEYGRRMLDAIRWGQPFQVTIPLRARDGSVHRFFTSAAPLRDADGKILQWFGTNTDLSELEQAEQAAKDSEERLREGMRAARMAVWDWDVETRRLTFAANSLDVFGIDNKDRDRILDFIHPDDKQALHNAVVQALERCGTCEALVRMRRTDAQDYYWLHVYGTAVCDEHGRAVTVRGISIDVTSRKQAEEALRAANQRKDDFLAMLAHELRNPLAPISTAAEIMQHLPVNDRIRELSTIIGRQAEHMNKLVDDLLDVSRVTRGVVKLVREPVRLGVIVEGAVEQAKSLIDSRKHTLVVHDEHADALVYVDRTRMVQVVANLLNNAAKYTAEGGHIEVSLGVEADKAHIMVRDNGIGIPRDLLPHIFELFIQAERSPDRSQGGLGLGLTLVHSLTELHGGTVSVCSDGVGQGSVFMVSLPLHREVKADAVNPVLPGEASQQAAAVAAPPTPNCRILIVDDNVDAAISLGNLLELYGHDVMVEHDAFEALERTKRERPEVLLLDIGLPHIDGYQLAQLLRAQPETADALLIAVTGYGQPEDLQRSVAAGFDHHFIKPVNTRALNEVLIEYERTRYATPPGAPS